MTEELMPQYPELDAHTPLATYGSRGLWKVWTPIQAVLLLRKIVQKKGWTCANVQCTRVTWGMHESGSGRYTSPGVIQERADGGARQSGKMSRETEGFGGGFAVSVDTVAAEFQPGQGIQ